MRAAARTVLCCAAAGALGTYTPVAVGAQVADSARAAAPARPAMVRPAQSRLTPPISPKRAFLYSFLLPGFGQSRLDRGTSGALFSSIELAALVMVRRSLADVREAKRYRLDSVPAAFTVLNGVFKPSGSVSPRFTRDLERTRRLHVEDWLAVLAFNHLFSGADAFVAAQLWDVPASFSARAHPDGAMLVATFRW